MSADPGDKNAAAGKPPDPALQPAGQLGPHAEPDDREDVYFEGSPPLRSVFSKMALAFVIALALITLTGWLFYKGYGPWWAKLIPTVLGLLAPVVPILTVHSRRYRISNYRIDYERGLLSRNIDTLELWHVEDLHFRQSLLDRILNIGTITVVSHDDTMPMLQIKGIPSPRPLYETLKQRVIAVKRQRGVIKMDPG